MDLSLSRWTISASGGLRFLLVGFFLALPVSAQAGTWTSGGPYGAIINAVVVSPNYAADQTVFAGAQEGGISKSTDGGASWSAVNAGLGSVPIYAMAISPDYGNDQTVFAGGGYKTTDGGASWSQGNAGLTGTVYALAISPNYATDQTLFAGTYNGGIHRSTDGGASWSLVRAGVNVYALAISPNYASDQTVFAGTSGNGIFKSTNGGSTWTAINSGLTGNNANWLSALVTSPNYGGDQTVFAGTWNGVYKSTNGGSTWVAQSTGISSVNYPYMAVSPAYVSDQTVFAGTDGVYKSTTGGASWGISTTGLGSYRVYAMATSPNYVSDQTVFAGTAFGGMYKSTNGGASWSAINSGLNAASSPQVTSVAISPNYVSDQTVFAGTGEAGVQKSTNGGLSWSRVNSGLGGLYTSSVVVSPTYASDQTAFVWTNKIVAANGNRTWEVYRTTNGGTSWLRSMGVGAGPCVPWGFPLAVSPTFAVDRTVFAVAGYTGSSCALSPATLYKSIDGGVSFSSPGSLGNVSVRSIAISPTYSTDQTVFVGASTGLLRSTNGGVSWTGVNTGLTGAVNSVTFSPNYSSDQTVFASSSSGVARSINGGVTWNVVNALIGMNAIALSPTYINDQTLFGANGRVYRSIDGGVSWSQLIEGATPQMNSVAVSPAFSTDGTLFAGAFSVWKYLVDDQDLTITFAGTGGGVVTSAPPGLSCTSMCSAAFDTGSLVTLTATPDATSTFDGWGGACAGSGSCTVTMNAAQAVTATFTRLQYSLSVTKAGSGTGTVSSSPAGISCGATCSAAFNAGTQLTLTVAPDASSVFSGWSGACSGTGACVVTMDAAKTVTATFTRRHTLTVTKTGSGAVTSTPAGITCGVACTAVFDAGITVTLIATPEGGSEFLGWSGACAGAGMCTVEMNADQTVLATFEVTLAVTKGGTGGGVVSSAPMGINCGATCLASFPPDTVVTLTAAPDGMSAFVGWSGACSGTGGCMVTMDSAKAVTATFNLLQYTLSVTIAGSGSGTVTSSPAGINCGATCSASFTAGTLVTLTATPAVGHALTGWSGACTGTAACTVTMDAAKSLTATFNQPVPLLFYKDGSVAGGTLGTSVYNGGDVDGDGVNDVIAGAAQDTYTGTASGPPSGPGRVEVYSGATGALLLSIAGEAVGDHFGFAVSGADVNSDGLTDIVVGAPLRDADDPANPGMIIDQAGSVYVYLSPGPPFPYDGSALPSDSYLWRRDGFAAQDHFGWHVGSVTSDVNGDGTNDVVIGAPQHTWPSGGPAQELPRTGDRGRAFVVSGTDGSTILDVEGETDGEHLGICVYGIGDLDGDGRAEFVVGAPFFDAEDPAIPGQFLSGVGRAYVFRGADGLVMYRIENPDGPLSADAFGSAVTGGADVNGDGVQDFVLAAQAADPNGRIDAGSVFLFSGADGGLLQRFDGENPGDLFGGCCGAISATGDVDGDGRADLVASAPDADPNGRIDAGSVYVYGYDGSTYGLIHRFDGEAAGYRIGAFGNCSCGGVANDGDLNGDGRADVVIGAPHVDVAGQSDAGRVYAFSLPAVPSVQLTIFKAGTGGGTVTSSPSGIACGTTCSAAFATGTVVTLTAVADSMSTFLAWSGACSGTGGCSVTMNAATSVTATFTTRAADLAVTKTDSPDPVTANNSMTYTMVVANNGPDRATGVTLTDTLPSGVTYVSASSTRGSCSESAGTVSCSIGNLRSGRTATVTIIVTPITVGSLSNTATVSATEGDPVPGNNSATATTTVNAPTSNTPVGSNVSVPLGSGLTVTFGTVSTAGETTVSIVTSGPPPPTSFRLGNQRIYYDLNTTATFSGPITVCFTYDDSQFSRENRLRLYHHTGSNWQNVTTALDTTGNVICGTTTSLSPFIVVEPDLADLSNISTRARVQTADNVMIGGFIVGGSMPKTVLIRARGGSLGGAPFNNPGVLLNPRIQLYSGQTVIAQNDDWQTPDPLCLSPAEDCGDAPEIVATGLDPCQPNPGQTVPPPGCSQESALYVTLPPGTYTAIVRGVGGTSGMGLIEVFDVDTSPAILINISTRARVETVDNVMIGGFIVGGSTSKTVLLRARGGSLGGAPFNNPGVLANPTMQLYSGQTVIAQNNDWQTTDALCLSPATACGGVSEITATGLDPCQPNPGQSVAPPGCSQESALYVTLPPGTYTAIVRGVGGTMGMGLVEVFEVP